MIYLVMQHVFTVLGTVDYYKMGRGCGNQRHWAGSIWIIPFNGEAKHLYKCTYQSPDPEALSTIKKKKMSKITCVPLGMQILHGL